VGPDPVRSAEHFAGCSVRVDRRTLLKTAVAAGGAAAIGRAGGSVAAAQQEARPFLADHRVVSFYGTPLAPGLGALGQDGYGAMLARLRAQAEAYAALDEGRTVVPALHLIYTVAQAGPTADGDYLNHAPDALVDELSALARDNGMLLFLDNQLGTSTIAREMARMAPWLAQPHVHLALDPEFCWGHPGLVPGGGPDASIGYLTAAQVNEAQATLQAIARDNGLPPKILVVHQFRYSMLPDKARIAAYDGIELVIDMDGFGPPVTKLATYDAVIVNDGVERPGIKLFYEYDVPLMTPASVLSLAPPPLVVIYQ
jgi:hypothetical protein